MLLVLVEQAVAGGWSRRRACCVLGLDERRARRWQEHAAIGELDDRPPGGDPVHGLMPWEIDEILALADEWGETDASHRKLAHRGSYLGRVWVAQATVFRVLLAHGRALPHRPAREPAVKAPWPDWVSHRPNQVWGYDLTRFPAARTQALAVVDLVSRRWIDHLLCPEATSLQVQVLFTRARRRHAGRHRRPRRAGSPTRSPPTPTGQSCSPSLTTGCR